MKLQNLILIFLAIALPVIIILSFYVELQVDTASLKSAYDMYLTNAGHETMTAFQINTVNDKFLTVSDAKIRDIEAALKVFSSSLSTSLGATGASRSSIMGHVPAMLFTLHDGYYIYTPTKSLDNGTFSHQLKTYVYYSKQYTDKLKTKILTINYSLDNYIAVYYDNGNSYQSRAGYLEVIPTDKVAFLKDLDNDAKKYYEDAWNFTKWFNEDVIENINIDSTNELKITQNNLALPEAVSSFNDEKYEVIRNSVTNNLIQAMHIYGKNTDNDFAMPKLTGEDWATILHNACFIAFLQGVPVGTTIYNNYVIVPSSENKEVVSENLLYYINVDNAGNPIGSYHRAWCPELKTKDTIIKGYNKNEFKNQKSSQFGSVPACYYCMVRASNDSINYVEEYYKTHNYPIGYDTEKRKIAYYNALAKEKLTLSKLSDFISGSAILEKK